MNAERIKKWRMRRPAAFIAGFAAFAFALEVLRSPSVVFRAQFYAEDGAIWYADAHNFGWWRPFFQGAAGYLQTLARAVAASSLAFPMRWAPTAFAVAALVIGIMPAVFLLSSRFKRSIPSDALRVAIAVTYLVLPNASELHGNVTNAYWCFSLLALMVLFADAPRTRTGRALDAIVIVLAGLSGPLAIFLAPVAIVLWWRRRTRHEMNLTFLLASTLVVQAAAAAFLPSIHGIERTVDLSFTYPFILLTRHAFLFGTSLWWVHPHVTISAVARDPAFRLIMAAGLAMFLYGLWKGPIELKLLIVFSLAVFLVGIWFPTIGMTRAAIDPSTAHDLLFLSGGIRYWFFPVIAFFMTITWSIRRASPAVLRVVAASFVVLMCVAIGEGFVLQGPKDMRYRQYIVELHDAPVGSVVRFPLNPGGPWRMDLRKK